MLSIFIHIVILAVAVAVGVAVGYWMFHHAPSSTLAGNYGDENKRTETRDRATDRELGERLRRLESELAGLRQKLVSAERAADQYRADAEKWRDELDRSQQYAVTVHQITERLQEMALGVSKEIASHSAEVSDATRSLTASSAPQDVLDTVARLLAANDKMRTRLELAEARLKEQEALLARQMEEAKTDALTGVWNRRAFDIELARLENEYRERQRPSSVMMLDVDHFKKFNDTYGHQAGDAVLKGVARTLRHCLSQDVLLFRYGGEEFAALFPGCDLTTSLPAAERARAAIAQQSFAFEGQQLKVTASAGVATFQKDESSSELVKRADEALYACKAAGRNCGHYHDGTKILPIPLGTPSGKTEPGSKTESEQEAPATSPSVRDPFTGLSTEEAFRDDLDRRLAAWKRGGAGFSLIVLEVDRFARLGTTFGNNAQKLVLKATAQFLKAAMRDMDHIARLGNAQFALLLPNANLENACGVAERLRLAIAKCRLSSDGGVLQFTVSAGVTQAMQHDTTDTLLTRALQNVQAAQEQEGNTVVSQPTVEMPATTR